MLFEFLYFGFLDPPNKYTRHDVRYSDLLMVLEEMMQKNDTYQGSGRLQCTRNCDSWTCSGWWLVSVVVHRGWSTSRIING